MTSIRIRDLIDLIASETPEPGKSLEKVFEWAHSRNLELIKWLLALAAALLAPLAIAFARGDIGTGGASISWLAWTLFGSVLFAGIGLTMLARGRRLYRRYLAAQALLGELMKIAPFIERYRERAE
jgi:hypothetical protein